MKTTTNTTSNKMTARFIVIVAIVMLSSVGMFAQNKVVAPAVAITQTVAADDTVASAANTATATATFNMVSWFMGTKQTTNATGIETGTSSKKQLINSGIAPNRLLLKAFLKKASNYATTVA